MKTFSFYQRYLPRADKREKECVDLGLYISKELALLFWNIFDKIRYILIVLEHSSTLAKSHFHLFFQPPHFALWMERDSYENIFERKVPMEHEGLGVYLNCYSQYILACLIALVSITKSKMTKVYNFNST